MSTTSSQFNASLAMDPSAAVNLNAPHEVLAMRNRPLSRDLGRNSADDSDFEFDFSEAYSDEPPVSPKLQSFSPHWKFAASPSMVSSTYFSAEHMYTAAPNTHYVDVIDAFRSKADSDYTIKSSVHKSYADGATGMIITNSDQSQKVRVNLRSLMLERRERDQLPPIVGTHRSNDAAAAAAADRNNADGPRPMRSSPSSSSSVISLESTSSLSQNHRRKSCRRWSLKLDFLQTKKGSCPSKATGDQSHLRHYAATNHATATIDELSASDYYDAVDMGDHEDGKVESPRQSTCSLSAMSSTAMDQREKGRVANQKSKSESAPVSPTGSPSRASIAPAQMSGTAAGHHLLYASNGARRPASPPGVKRPMSPHAQHYQQQRARAEELGRRTSLPYRQSLFGACFFLPSRSQVAC